MPLGQTAPDGRPRRRPTLSAGNFRNSAGEKLISAAEQAGSADYYRSAGAADLPFENCSFDLAVAYNVLMDIEDVPAALKEIRRVLRPSGTLVISIVHPFADRWQFADSEADAPFVVQKSYFGRERFEGTEVRNGVKMHFAGWSQPLESYVAALKNAVGNHVAARARPGYG